MSRVFMYRSAETDPLGLSEARGLIAEARLTPTGARPHYGESGQQWLMRRVTRGYMNSVPDVNRHPLLASSAARAAASSFFPAQAAMRGEENPPFENLASALAQPLVAFTTDRTWARSIREVASKLEELGLNVSEDRFTSRGSWVEVPDDLMTRYINFLRLDRSDGERNPPGCGIVTARIRDYGPFSGSVACLASCYYETEV